MEYLRLPLIFENPLRHFADDQNEQYYFAFSDRCFIPSSRILWEATQNDEQNFAGKTFLLIDNREYIYFPM